MRFQQMLLTMVICGRRGSIFGQRWQSGYHHDMLLGLQRRWDSPDAAAALETQLVEVAFANAIGGSHR